MKWIFTFVLVAIMATDIDRIARINELKDEAREAYNSGNYDKALENYRYLVDSMNVSDDKILLNMANALYQLKDTAAAIGTYQSVSGSQDNLISSVAHQQLGILSNRTKNFEEALNHFKQALKKDPTNEDARYNYELLKKVLDEQKKNEEKNKDEQNKEDQQDKKDEKGEQDEKSEIEENKQNPQKEESKEGEQEKKDEQSKEQGKEGEESEQEQKDSEKTKESEDAEKKSQQEKEGTPQDEESQDEQNEARQQEIAERLKDMKISEEKARMILEAMKNNEVQYIQQNKRKPTKKRDSSKPDW